MTEKNYNPNQKERNAMKKQTAKAEKSITEKAPVEKPEEKKPVEEKLEETNQEEVSEKAEETKEDNKKAAKEGKKEKSETKKAAKKVKKEEVYVNAKSVPVSTKYAISICKFVKGKRVGDAIRDLEQVVLMKKPVPMKGEYAHRKGKGMSSGKYPQSAAKHFIVLLKSLAGNANNHEILEPVIVEAMANWAPAPMGRFGRVKRKRTHVMLVAKEMKIKENKKSKDKKQESEEKK